MVFDELGGLWLVDPWCVLLTLGGALVALTLSHGALAGWWRRRVVRVGSRRVARIGARRVRPMAIRACAARRPAAVELERCSERVLVLPR